MWPIRPRVLRAAAVACAAAGLVTAASTSPATAGAATAGAGATATIQIGPIPAAHGFAMYVTEQDCGSTDPTFQVAFLTGRAPNLLTHTYTGATASCTLLHSPGGAQLRARLPGVINLDARIAQSGPALAHPGLPVGCGAPYGREFPATATGRVDIAIHPAVFGRLNRAQASAEIFSAAPERCPAVQPGSGRELTADLGPFVLDAAAPAHASPVLDIYDGAGDRAVAGLVGTLELALGGNQAYASRALSGSATVGSVAPLASGSLSFTALAACPGAAGVNAAVAGTLTIDDPLLGRLAVRGADATLAFTGIGGARAGGCNGPGSEAVEPALISNCSVSDGSCSVQADTNTVTLFDETDPGTQTVSSEQVDFGDGSAPVPMALGASVTHTYSQPGTYTATVTVTDAMGTSTTASTTVDIAA